MSDLSDDGYVCARCGSHHISDEVDDDGDRFEDEDRPLVWCHDCGDLRYAEYDGGVGFVVD